MGGELSPAPVELDPFVKVEVSLIVQVTLSGATDQLSANSPSYSAFTSSRTRLSMAPKPIMFVWGNLASLVFPS